MTRSAFMPRRPAESPPESEPPLPAMLRGPRMTPTGKADRLLAFGGIGVLLAALLVVLGSVFVGRADHSAVKQPFHLVDTRGRAVDLTIFQGRPSIVYFGYTNCPEVCPTTLIEMADWLRELGPEGDALQALFFTVDPARDTPDVMTAYVGSISDRILGVTGSEEEMRKASDGWRVQAARDGEGDTYHMRHSTSLLMVGSDGRLKGLIPYETSRETALERIRSRLLSS